MVYLIKEKFAKLQTIHQAHYRLESTTDDRSLLVFLIILLVVTSQLSLTIYLPSMPNMVEYFHTDIPHIQWTITIYLIGYGASQFFYGPLSDKYGRRTIILFGLLIFLLASLICMTVNDIQLFLIGRLLQGIGIGCGDTMGRAILCDKFKDKSFVKAACVITVAATVTPMLGPIFGGYIQALTTWWLNFVIIFLYGFFVLLTIFFFLPETKPHDLIGSLNFKEISNTYLFILKNRIFIAFFIPGLISFLGETLYNMMSSFLLQDQLQWDVISFSWLNMLTVVGLLIGALLASFFSHYTSYIKMVFFGVIIMTAAALLMLILCLLQPMNTFNILFPIVIFMIGIGITYPNTNMGALTPFTAMAGTAGALQGGLQMLIGGFLGIWVSKISLQSQWPLSIILTLITLTGLILFVILVRSKE